MLRSIQNNQSGLSYIEILVSLLLVIILIVVINTILVGKTLQSVTGERSLAYQLAQEQMETILNQEFENLISTTTAPFIYILYNEGTQIVTTDGSAPSAPHVLEMTSNANVTSTITAQTILPKNNYADFSLTFDGVLKNDSPVIAGLGLFFRAQDYLNGYRLIIDNANITLDKIENGVTTTITSSAYFLTPETWDEYEVIVTGDLIELRINSISQFTVNDSTFTDGYVALIGTESAHIYLDDINMIDQSGTDTWNFDSTPVGNLGAEWTRQSINSLHNGRGEVTIGGYMGSDQIKEVIVEVFWDGATGPTSISLQTLVTK